MIKNLKNRPNKFILYLYFKCSNCKQINKLILLGVTLKYSVVKKSIASYLRNYYYLHGLIVFLIKIPKITMDLCIYSLCTKY